MDKTNPLDPYYQKQRDVLDKQKTDDISALERSRVQQRQEAAINNELLMKYLPQLNKANGLAGLGVSETANIDALSRYQTNLGKIEASHQQGVSDIERAYRSDLAKIDAAERTEKLAEEDRLRTEAKEKYGEAYEVILSGHITDSNVLSKYLTDMGFDEGTKERSALEAYATPYLKKTELENEKLGADTDAAGNKIVAAYSKGDANNKFDFVGAANASANLDNAGATFFVSVGDKDIPVSSGGLVPSETIPETVRSYAENDKVFMYDGGIYIKKNGSIYQIAPAGDGSDPEYNRAYNDLKSYLNGGTAPTVDASPEHSKPVEGTTNAIVGNTYYDENGNSSSFESVMMWSPSKNLREKLGALKDGSVVDYYGVKYYKDGDQIYKITKTT